MHVCMVRCVYTRYIASDSCSVMQKIRTYKHVGQQYRDKNDEDNPDKAYCVRIVDHLVKVKCHNIAIVVVGQAKEIVVVHFPSNHG